MNKLRSVAFLIVSALFLGLFSLSMGIRNISSWHQQIDSSVRKRLAILCCMDFQELTVLG